MEIELNPAELISTIAGVQLDRLRNLRVYEHFVLKVRGVDAEGAAFDIDTVVENLSSGGLYFSLQQRVAIGETLFFVIYMSGNCRKQVMTIDFRKVTGDWRPSLLKSSP